MTFVNMLRFEFRYLLRHVSTWLLFTVMLLFGFFILRLVSLDGDTKLNAPGTVAFFTVFGTVIWLVIGAMVAGDAATRDLQMKMYPLTFTTPVSKARYLAARYGAALLLNVLIVLTLYLGMLLSFYAPGAKTQFIGPFRLATYFTNFFFIALPTVLAGTSIQFAFAALSGRAVAGYVASIVIVIFSQFGGTTVMFLLEWRVLGRLMDLLGTGIVADMEGWTPIEKNTRLVTLEGWWFWNRFAWMVACIIVLTITYFRFRMEQFVLKRFWPKLFYRRRVKRVDGTHVFAGSFHTNLQTMRHTDAVTRLSQPVKVQFVLRRFNLATQLRQVMAIAANSYRIIAMSRGGLTLVAVLSIGTGLFATEYMEWLGVPLLARTGEVLRALTPPLSSFRSQWIVIPLLLIFYAGELIWRDREAGINELTDTTPTTEAVMFCGRFFGIALIVTTWLAMMMMAGIINQLVMGYYDFEITLYLKTLFGIQLLNYLLFAVLVMVIHVMVHQKYIGHMLAIGVYGIILFADRLGLEHRLLIYASDTGWSYSDMRGFEPFVAPWLWFKFYWMSWAVLLAVIAMLFWVRNKVSTPPTRWHIATTRLPRYKLALMTSAVFVLVTGGFIFYNTNILNKYTTTADRKQMRATYERLYGRYEYVLQPTISSTKLEVELYPADRKADISGSYQLVNNGLVAIDSVHISSRPGSGLTDVSFDRAARAIITDRTLGYYVYKFVDPLSPGDSVMMRFKIGIRPNGFSNDGVDEGVVSNGTHLTSDRMPVIGFDDNRVLRDANDRATFGLAARPAEPSLYDAVARNNRKHADLMDFEITIGTAGDQLAVAPGDLVRTWSVDDRRYFRYVTDSPIHNSYKIFSARYEMRERQWRPSDTVLSNRLSEAGRPVIIQVYYHTGHDNNIDRMLSSAAASLNNYTREFGAYPYSHFRVVERPGAGRGMHAEPMTIDYPEGYSLMNPSRNGLDLPYHIMAHEMAHQWWGFTLAPAAVEGAGLLVESLATYSAMQVVEEILGYEHLLRYLSQMRQEYEVPRSRAAPPLLRSNNAFMNYRKGPFALFALRHYIGKDKVNDAIRGLLAYDKDSTLVTTLNFYHELRKATPDTLQYLVHDLFAANTFWELKTETVSAVKSAAGDWQVKLEIAARKSVVDEAGVDSEVPMNDLIEIGVSGDTSSGSDYLQKHRIRSGKQTVFVTVPFKPVRAGIDPQHLLVDLNMEDNSQSFARID